MPTFRTTVDRSTVTEAANRMILFLSDSGTREDQIKREAIIAVVDSILHDGNSYAGFRYLQETPTVVEKDGWKSHVWDNTRISFY